MFPNDIYITAHIHLWVCNAILSKRRPGTRASSRESCANLLNIGRNFKISIYARSWSYPWREKNGLEAEKATLKVKWKKIAWSGTASSARSQGGRHQGAHHRFRRWKRWNCGRTSRPQHRCALIRHDGISSRCARIMRGNTCVSFYSYEPVVCSSGAWRKAERLCCLWLHLWWSDIYLEVWSSMDATQMMWVIKAYVCSMLSLMYKFPRHSILPYSFL